MNIAILLSGGAGRRMGIDVPKQYIRVSGKLLITYCLETLLTHPMIDAVQIAATEEWAKVILTDAGENGLDTGKICGFSEPGTERQVSVFHALKDLKTSESVFSARAACKEGYASDRILISDTERAPDNVLIHDAVRPNLSKEQITSCFEVLRGHDGVMPALPMKDTVYLSGGGGRVSGLLDREKVFAGQAPEVFDFEKYYEANVKLLPDGLQRIKGSTEPAVLAGMDVAMIPGDENNYKITTLADLERFRRQKEEEGR